MKSRSEICTRVSVVITPSNLDAARKASNKWVELLDVLNVELGAGFEYTGLNPLTEFAIDHVHTEEFNRYLKQYDKRLEEVQEEIVYIRGRIRNRIGKG